MTERQRHTLTKVLQALAIWVALVIVIMLMGAVFR